MNPPEPPPRWVIGALLMAVSLEALFTTAAAAILLGSSHSVAGLGALFAAPAVTGAGGIAYTMKRAQSGPVSLRLAAVVLIVGLVIMAVASSWQVLVVGRLVGSFGGATIVSGTYASLAIDANFRRRGLLVGLVGVAISIPAVLVPILSATAERFDASFVFGGLAAVALATIPFLPRVHGRTHVAPDLGVLRVWAGAGFVITSLWLAATLDRWQGATVLAVGLVTGVPMIRGGIQVPVWQTNRQNLAVGIRAIAMALFFGVDIILPIYMIEDLSLGAPVAAVTVVTSALGWAVVSAAFPALQRSNRLETASVAGGAALFVAVIGSGAVLHGGLSAPAAAAILGALWFAAGMGVGVVAGASTELVIVDQRTPSGVTGASLQMLDAVSIAVGTGLSGFLLTQTSAMACLGALGLLAVAASVFVSVRGLHDDSKDAVGGPWVGEWAG